MNIESAGFLSLIRSVHLRERLAVMEDFALVDEK